MIRMLIVGYCYGIRFESCARRLSCTLLTAGSAGSISTTEFLFSVNRHGRFRDSDVFRQIFEGVVRACMDAGLVKGEGFAVDASVMEADASRYHGVKPEEADWPAPERQTRAVPSSWERWTMRMQTPIASCQR
jgi:transposase